MLKEIKFLLAISSFIFLIYIILNYYFSDSYKKKSFRSVNNFTNKNLTNTKIPFIKSDTTDIIELINNYEDLTEPKIRKFEEIIK
tara:strand:- start:29 stop:283 length:255 start_codon:yes stop_codon:yes gene_type:complete